MKRGFWLSAGLAASDSEFRDISLPFPFDFYGTPYRSVRIFHKGYLSFAGYANNPFGGYIPFPHVRPGRTPPVGAWLWTAGYELAWRELGVTF